MISTERQRAGRPRRPYEWRFTIVAPHSLCVKRRKNRTRFFQLGRSGTLKLQASMPDTPESESRGTEWEIVKDLVFQWETDHPSDLDGWLREHCPTPAIRKEVERLARAAATSGDFLETGAAQEHLGIAAQHPVNIGRYRVIEELGAGGSGVVYAAYDPTLERKVAIKVLAERTAAANRHRKRLRWDAKAASATNHPNIV